jgi:hypothetical protein
MLEGLEGRLVLSSPEFAPVIYEIKSTLVERAFGVLQSKTETIITADPDWSDRIDFIAQPRRGTLNGYATTSAEVEGDTLVVEQTLGVRYDHRGGGSIDLIHRAVTDVEVYAYVLGPPGTPYEYYAEGSWAKAASSGPPDAPRLDRDVAGFTLPGAYYFWKGANHWPSDGRPDVMKSRSRTIQYEGQTYSLAVPYNAASVDSFFGGFSGAVNPYSVFAYATADLRITVKNLIADVSVREARFQGNTARVDFTWTQTDRVGTVEFGLYRSADQTFDGSDQLVAMRTASASTTGDQLGTFLLGSELTGDPARPYLLVVADPRGKIQERSENNNTTDLVLPTVTLRISPTRDLTVMDEVTFEVLVSPRMSGDFEIETRWLSAPDGLKKIDPLVDSYQVLARSQSHTSTKRLVGNFRARGSVTIDGIRFETPHEYSYRVQFPSYDDIVADPSVQAETDFAWELTKQYAYVNRGTQAADGTWPDSRRREYGFWIRLDTSGSGSYIFEPLEEGEIVGPGDGGELGNSPMPPDLYEKGSVDAPGYRALYTVARFHSHTPTTYRHKGRPVGPSSSNDGAAGGRVVGIVYDYISSTGEIPPGHPLDSVARRWPSGPFRRPLGR